MKLELVATCLFGLEKLLGEEIDALGYKRIETMDGRITYEGDERAVFASNLNLRFAERVFIKLGSFSAQSFEELYEGTAALPWENFIGKNDAFPVKGHALRSALFSVPDCQSIVKKAVVNRLANIYNIRWFAEERIKYQIEFFIFKNIATLMIDTSGIALHKRGYRIEAGAAPLRETLAAAVAAISRPREDVLLWDPFCGSGTIAIEAALMMTNTAPGIARHFACEKFDILADGVIAKEERAKAFAAIDQDCEFEAYASDIDPAVLEIAKQNAERAGVDDRIKFFEADARKIKKLDRRGTIVCNPPYGERLMTQREVEKLYREMGDAFSALSPWQIYVLTSAENFQTLYGRRADKVRKLYNGMIPCTLYQYFKNNTFNK
ncbi:MAG: class I SAM-dependent RNA methyltransferase [Ruminococcaceae bacterium]|nr:class I SAM-dependent RNA methyltransferase [Oscillospiraceae bacterium]